MPSKINHPGLRLRKKSPVHAKVIDENTGRRKRDTIIKKELDLFKTISKESWGQPGEQVLGSIKPFLFKDITKIRSLYKSTKKPVDIMVLGPGEGAEVLFLKSFLENTPTNIDTLGLSNHLSASSNSKIRKDYSPDNLSERNTFDHFNHLSLVKKYSYIYSHLGPGYYTPYAEIALLKIASMLRPGGFARIHVLDTNPNLKKNILEYLNQRSEKNNIKIKASIFNDWIVIKRLK
ncbi:MAG: hypothetical protein WCF78_00215 [archaeon]